MKILLIDMDSTIPNLALMKVSAWYKSQGDTVGFNIPDPDIVYCSIIFDWNRHKADGLRFLYPNAKINIGGSGYDINARLPDYIERMPPDYDLYGGLDYDLGFTTRGCIRNCYFCIVPKKEGAFKVYEHPRQFHDPRHKKIVLMDNNILANKSWFYDVTDWILDHNLKVDFNQGLDIRLLDRGIADRLHELKPIGFWRFAFDSMNYKADVEHGINILNRAGVNVRNKTLWYVYLHDDNQFPDALERCEILRSLDALPYPMFNRHAKRTPRMTALKRWCRPWIFFSADWVDYDAQIKGHVSQNITIPDTPKKMESVSVGYRSKKGNTNGGITKP